MNIEYKILDFIRDTFSCEFMDALMKAVSFLGNAGWFWIVSAVILLIPKKTRKIGITVSIALIFSLIFCNLTIKPIIARIRPYDLKEGIELIISKPTDFSFPSGHSSASFAAAMAMMLHNRKIGIPALVLATFIAFSRLYLYVHFPTDVFGGILLGSACGVGAFFLVKYILKKIPLDKRRFIM